MNRASGRIRKAALTLHVSCSVGWLGAVLAFLVLAVSALAAPDRSAVEAQYGAMNAIGWGALVPLALLTLATGVTQSLITPWGLVRYHWVLIKLVIAVVAVTVLLLFVPGLGPDEGPRGPAPLVHGAAAVVLLGLATVLSIFKPPGRTRFGR